MQKYLIILFSLLIPLISFGQNESIETSSSEFEIQKIPGGSPIIQDSLPGRNIEEMMNSSPPPKDEFQMSKSPTEAILWTFLFPGAGQIYVESYWKAPIFAAGAGLLAYNAIANHNEFNTFDNEANTVQTEINNLEKELETIPTDDPLYETIQTNILINKTTLQSINKSKEVYRNNRDQSIFFMAGIYLLAAVDAYVGAHLFDFSVGDDLSMNFNHSVHKGLCLDLRIRF